MAVFFRFRSAKAFDSIPIDGEYITVEDLKLRIVSATRLDQEKNDFDLVLELEDSGQGERGAAI